MAGAPLTIYLMGPTAAGKSALAVELAEALPVEIVSVDSAQVYRGLDIGTAKPEPALRARVPHHLIDLRDPAVTYSVAEFVADAGAAMGDSGRTGRCQAEGFRPFVEHDEIITAAVHLAKLYTHGTIIWE